MDVHARRFAGDVLACDAPNSETHSDENHRGIPVEVHGTEAGEGTETDVVSAPVAKDAEPLAETAVQQEMIDNEDTPSEEAIQDDASVHDRKDPLSEAAVEQDTPRAENGEPATEEPLQEEAPPAGSTQPDAEDAVQQKATLEGKVVDELPVKEYLDTSVVPILRDGLRLLAKERSGFTSIQLLQTRHCRCRWIHHRCQDRDAEALSANM